MCFFAAEYWNKKAVCFKCDCQCPEWRLQMKCLHGQNEILDCRGVLIWKTLVYFVARKKKNKGLRD